MHLVTGLVAESPASRIDHQESRAVKVDGERGLVLGGLESVPPEKLGHVPQCGASLLGQRDGVAGIPAGPDPLQVWYREEGVLEVAVGLKTAARQDHASCRGDQQAPVIAGHGGTCNPVAVGRHKAGCGMPVQDGYPAGGKARREQVPQCLAPPQGRSAADNPVLHAITARNVGPRRQYRRE